MATYKLSPSYFASYIKNTGKFMKDTLADSLFLRPFMGASGDKSLFDFNKLDGWGIGTDIDIGGYSTAKLQTTTDNSLRFSGNISLALSPSAEAMYSGYAAFRSRIPYRRHLFDKNTIDCSKWSFMVLRVKGDHRSYNFNFRIRNSFMGDLYTAKVKFLNPYEWEDVILPFHYFKKTNCGVQYARQYEPNLENVESFGVLLADNLPGPFNLEIQSLKLTNLDYKYAQPSKEDEIFLAKNLVDKTPRDTWKDSADNFYGFGFDMGAGQIEDRQKYLRRLDQTKLSGRILDSEWSIKVIPSGRPKPVQEEKKKKQSAGVKSQ